MVMDWYLPIFFVGDNTNKGGEIVTISHFQIGIGTFGYSLQVTSSPKPEKHLQQV
jgi:hypothetical protein